MATLWKRANGPQHRMLRIVSGAVMNTANAHPNARPDKNFARGVAKRAVGTISAQWAELLAAAPPSSGMREGSLKASRCHRSILASDGSGRRHPTNAAPFTKLCATLGRKITPLRMAGDDEGVQAVRDAIKALATLARRERESAP